MHRRDLELTRQWHWGIAVVGDPTGEVPDLDPGSLATVGDATVVLLVHHAQDVGLDDDLATGTIHVRVIEGFEPHQRTGICDVVLATPSHAVSIGDADDEVTITGLTDRTRLVASTDVVRPLGLDEVWLDLVVL